MSIFDRNKVLIFAPHPDDEVLGCSSIIQWAVKNGHSHKIIIVTNGEAELIGGLLAFCKDRQWNSTSFNIGAAKLVSRIQTGINAKLFIKLRDQENKPLAGVGIQVINEKIERFAKTNELGWAILEVHPGNLIPEVKLTLKDEFTFKVKDQFVPSFMQMYGQRRLCESYAALESLSVNKGDIDTWGYKDGTLSQITPLTQEYEALVEKIYTVLREFVGGMVIIPHPLDIDPDHRALAELVQRTSTGMDLQLYKYLIHPQIDHRSWPLPAYRHAIIDRLELNEMLTPPDIVAGAEYEQIFLSQVGLTSEAKLGLIQQYQSQCNVDELGFLTGFAKINEIFFR